MERVKKNTNLVLQQRNHLGQFSVLLRGESRGERDYGTPVGWMDGWMEEGWAVGGIYEGLW